MEFVEFWEVWPKKVHRQAAERAWRRLSGADRQGVFAALQDHLDLWEAEQRAWRFVPDAATWLRGRRWEDEIPDRAFRPQRVMSADDKARLDRMQKEARMWGR